MHILYQRHVSQKNYEEFSKLGFKLYEIPEKIRHPIKNYFYTKKYFRDNSINVVHAHMTLVNFIPLIAAKKCNIKIRISHSHNSDVRKKTILKKFFEKIMKNLTIKYSTYNLACGIDAGKYLYGKQNFIILNNALDLNRYLYNFNIRKKLMEKYNIDESTLIIGNIGRFTVQKNQKFLIDIFSEVYKQNKNSILLIIGDGKLREELEKKVKELNLINNIIFTGIVNNTNEYYSLMDIFVLPSLWEGLPIAGIEAQVSGLKCLFSNKIDNDVIVIENNVKKLDLKLNEWSREILSISKNYNRNIDKKIFSNRGFDICNEAKKIENIYLGKKDN
jgi:glycosyltransferase involved in cell wall biosynthesis